MCIVLFIVLVVGVITLEHLFKEYYGIYKIKLKRYNCLLCLCNIINSNSIFPSLAY